MGNTETPFDKFQLEEYKNISTAHFETVKQISSFFRYYLLILAAPVFILNLVSGADGGITKFLEGRDLQIYYSIVSLYFVVVALIGFAIFVYVINLRLDAILYARVVNKVRKYFYETSELEIDKFDRYLQLPIVATKPRYFEKTFFVPIVFVFSIINCGMLYSALKIKLLNAEYFGDWLYPLKNWLLDVRISSVEGYVIAFFFILHLAAYLTLVNLRNNSYLKDYLIGVDIDGVLNDQTSHFVKWLKDLTGKVLDPTMIKEIPVNLNTATGITDLDERIVFNTKEYWQTLPARIDAAKRVNEFQKRFGFKILFFSYRDWPQYGAQEAIIKQAILAKNLTPLKKGEIKKITQKWLKDNGVNAYMAGGYLNSLRYAVLSLFRTHKKAVLEMGNPYISDTRFWNRFRKAILNKNRFQGASLKGFRYFIEDTPENAIKLSGLCDYVFMFDEPYNAASNYEFPKNIIRVSGWNDVYKHLKKLS